VADNFDSNILYQNELLSTHLLVMLVTGPYTCRRKGLDNSKAEQKEREKHSN